MLCFIKSNVVSLISQTPTVIPGAKPLLQNIRLPTRPMRTCSTISRSTIFQSHATVAREHPRVLFPSECSPAHQARQEGMGTHRARSAGIEELAATAERARGDWFRFPLVASRLSSVATAGRAGLRAANSGNPGRPWPPAWANSQQLAFFEISSETSAEDVGFPSQHENMPAGRRPEHAPSSAAGKGCFHRTSTNWRVLPRRWYPFTSFTVRRTYDVNVLRRRMHVFFA